MSLRRKSKSWKRLFHRSYQSDSDNKDHIQHTIVKPKLRKLDIEYIPTKQSISNNLVTLQNSPRITSCTKCGPGVRITYYGDPYEYFICWLCDDVACRLQANTHIMELPGPYCCSTCRRNDPLWSNKFILSYTRHKSHTKILNNVGIIMCPETFEIVYTKRYITYSLDWDSLDRYMSTIYREPFKEGFIYKYI